ncbi:TIGR03986 family CRISPR-associated RAMP protein [Cronbergia sp. UHCC 0137]|uniref:TIGR03986 family type III CRISPR-associated RAMP protein n=1 Tax=Cronbergia sp. UHCC 0137 TaxID=3110239 RepID=UPI002B21289E|nr:TIGR03986 family CRISPR-associated RAMP protein [Cronbergia sp. UHCC 0137]MEA5619865.1 TIGR03986 family CRISPR-associated RAMP protein [Cronbergia sp. UHCC 0137]
MLTGKLIVIANKTLQVNFTNAKGKTGNFNIKESELSANLLEIKKTDISQLNNLEVELEEIGGQPKQIREKGKAFASTQPTISTPKREIATPAQVTRSSNASPRNNKPPGDFHNPYNFVPAPPRNTENVQKSELGDRTPCGHDSYLNNHWSGRISVTLTTITPLLIPDAAKAQGTDHKIYPIRLDADGKPYLPPTSIKGMLRSAYEAITNSRLSIFVKHEDRLAFRMSTKNDLIPARVESQNNQLVLRLMEAPELLGDTARLLRYQKSSNSRDKGEIREAVRYDDSNELPQHGDAVWVRINKGLVTRIRKWDAATYPGDGEWLKGWVLVTGANINGKKYERVFIEKNDNESIIITDEIKSLWRELINNYQESHIKDLENRRKNNQNPQDYLGATPGKTGWSRHIYEHSELELKEGTLCYVELKNNRITDLFPVSISRQLYNVSPASLLDSNLKPTTEINSLSPADRVFGWVNQNGQGSYKGNLRINSVECNSDDSIETFGENGFPLAILGEPKPQQARFYIAKDKEGTPLDEGISKEKTYQSNNGLRGRKVYPHHNNLPAQHWNKPNEDRTKTDQGGYFQEYRRPKKDNLEQRDDQNRSIKAWVKPDTTFSFNIDVNNLSDVELGALLWLLSLPENYYHRLGGAKPLGFGSVKLTIDWNKTDLRKGENWREFYSSLISIPNSSPKDAQTKIQIFKDTVAEVYGNGQSFEQVRFIKAFCYGCQGFNDNKPVHYPRKRQQQGQNPVPPHPDGEAFKWFVENERTGGSKVSLPALWDETGLPYFDPR